ncbi:MAG TPA: phosphotransferase [Acidimicrobiia bacterium]|jgi:trehalose synthase-fused probable maltokinase
MSSDAAVLGLRGDLDEALTSDYLREQRWFGAQTREVSGVTVVDSVPVAVDLAVALVDVNFSGGGRALYQVLLGESDGEVRDATRQPDISRRVLELVATGGSSDGRDGRITYKAIRSIDGVESFDVELVGGDQSNTSTVVGNLMLKTYRRVVAGVNPELDMLLFFSEHGFAHVPNLVGWYSYAGTHIDATLGIVQCFVPDAVDGWKLGLEEVATAPAVFGARLRRLGQVVGEMHTVLASDAADAAFMPEEPTPESSGLVTAKIDEEIDSMFDEFSARDELAPLAGRRDDAHSMIAQLAGGFTPGRMIRTHGDLHLGQTLWAAHDWLVIDFEGEPARPASERRQKSFPLRDVAGMLRSISYLVATLERDGHEVPGGWEAEAREQLLDGYRTGAPGAVLPQSVEAQDRQLGLFELEKAFYELRYELDNRPDFVPIPVQSILAILERQVQ